jgi:hypothetical protein
MTSTVISVVTPRGSKTTTCFEGTSRLHLQGRRVSQETSKGRRKAKHISGDFMMQQNGDNSDACPLRPARFVLGLLQDESS